jgi:N12 class adenine-specific DNA methylase
MVPGPTHSRPLLPGLDFSARPAAPKSAALSFPEGPLARRSSPGPLFDQAHDTVTEERIEGALERSSQNGHESRVVSRVVVSLDLSRTTFTNRGQGSEQLSYTRRVAAARARLPARNQPKLPFDRPVNPRETSTGLTSPKPRDEAIVEAPPLSPSITPRLQVDSEGACTSSDTRLASGEKAKARDILVAIRTLKHIEREERPATHDEREALSRFGGFGPVALSLFADPVTGSYKDATWQALGEMLAKLLTAEEYESAKRTTFNAFYTSPVVIEAMHEALTRLGVPADATVLEPGCGIGRFMSHAPKGVHFIGVELDSISGRIARILHPEADIRIESFADTHLPDGSIDAVIGNVPFADLKLDYHGQRLSLHDFFFAKSIDALKPKGVLALVTSHFTLDKQNAGIREYLARRADFVGAIRLPSDAFKREGTSVVTDIVFLRRRAPPEPENHADPLWLEVEAKVIDDAEIPINRYFLNHSEMVLGTWSRKDRLYSAGYSLESNGDVEAQLRAAIGHLPEGTPSLLPSQRHEVRVSFRPPPPVPHITEGSFFLGEGRIVCQVTGGQARPVTYGGTLLKAGGTLSGKRMAALLELRDSARLVLQSQNEGWPDSHRNSARRDLNRVYDLFVSSYGPINKTTLGETADGTTIRRMPNLVKFREDPDAMLVMSLEEYDEATGRARKAAIMMKDVVGRTPEVTSVTSAEEGLLVSLDRRGAVDLPFIASLYGKAPSDIISELGDLIFQAPQNESWQTADAYLSGNVREKLVAAEAAGLLYERNAKALLAVQPEDILPGDIDANLGAPWIPEDDIEAFAAALFNVPPSAIRVGHLKIDAVWSIDADATAERSVAATSELGTARANGVSLLEQALNLKTPVIYDTIMIGEREERVVNQEATLSARDKQAQIKERFRNWVFNEPERTERLVRTYNDTYNNLRPRLFDGSHLDFPGLNQTITLRRHQVDAVWRGMSSGNTLLAHVVGSGKTYTMAAIAMKMRQANLIKKPMFAVPNHMLEQFGREFMQLYPNAKLLIATKDDLARDRRKFLTAKVASGEWDGIIVTHSSFERIGMSRGFQERFLREQIAEYQHLLCDHARCRSDTARPHRNIIKTLEKQKANREARLKDLLAQDKKDDGLVFDELGVDHLFIDEAHFFKNLETPTKMERVAGIQTGGSERAFDLYMKARYLDERHPGHGVTFATGTPISNTMVETFTMQRFLDPQGLRSRGIEHFDAWAATFGEVVDTMEISPDGKTLKPRSRFARFVNLPELQQMFRASADVQTAEMLDLPRPQLEGGKAKVIASPMSEEQARLQDELVARYARIRTQKVDPREDNALAITTDGRKLALDARLLSEAVSHYPGSKIFAMLDNVAAIWQQTALRRGTQLIFCDLGVHYTAWGYSVYEEISQELTARGIPRGEIAAVGEADSDAKKQALFERVRNGSVRVLIGSTQKMGTGMNVQRRLVALHHLDAPWKPAEVEQREGRILRQGNENKEVGIFRYVTEGSFDAYMWQALETKARFISQVMTGQSAVRRAEDIGGEALSYAEVKAIASGNPAVLTLAEADAELQRLAILKKNHADEQFLARRRLRELPESISCTMQRVTHLAQDISTLAAHANDSLILGDRVCNGDVLQVLGSSLKALPEKVPDTRHVPLGRFCGLRFGVVLHSQGSREVFLEGATTRYGLLSRESHGPRAVLNALECLSGSYEAQCSAARKELAITEGQLRDYESRLGKPFVHDVYLRELTQLRDQIRTALSDASPEPGGQPLPPAAELSERIQALKSCHSIEPAPERQMKRNPQAAEAPVTTRIRERMSVSTAEPASDLPPLSAEPFGSPVPVPATRTTVPTLSEVPFPRFEGIRIPVMKHGSRKAVARSFQLDQVFS